MTNGQRNVFVSMENEKHFKSKGYSFKYDVDKKKKDVEKTKEN